MSDSSNIPFIFRVSVNNGEEITLPLFNAIGFPYNMVVDWGDGSTSTVTEFNSEDRIHQYQTAGSYEIAIYGNCPAFRVNNSPIRNNITEIIQFGDVRFRFLDFFGCSNITTLPPTTVGLSTLIDVSNFLRATGITTIPADIFSNSPNIIAFTDAFSFTQITSIPSTVFSQNVSAQSFNSTFNGCISLISIPSDLFVNNVNLLNLSSTFRSCISLTEIPSTLFDTNTNVNTFQNIFNMPTPTNALSGNAPELWLRVPIPNGLGAFRNCFGLTNYNDIPVDWK